MHDHHPLAMPENGIKLEPKQAERGALTVAAILAVPLALAAPGWFFLALIVLFLPVIYAATTGHLWVGWILRRHDIAIVELSHAWTETVRSHVLGCASEAPKEVWRVHVSFTGWLRPRDLKVYAGPGQACWSTVLPGDTRALARELDALGRQKLGLWRWTLLWATNFQHKDMLVGPASTHALIAARHAVRMRSAGEALSYAAA